MSANSTSSNDLPPALRWRLWIDGCGGFLLLTGDRWSVGGPSSQQLADICVRADWPRNAGTIERNSGDYFWRANDNGSPVEHGHSIANSIPRALITSGRPLPIPGSACVTLQTPSPLSSSATLTLTAPHRFADHVDGVVLVDQTLLIGPQPDCHIRCHQLDDRIVLTCRGDTWMGKVGLAADFEELVPGNRVTLQSLAMTLEKA